MRRAALLLCSLALIFFRSDASVDVDAGGEGNIDLTVKSCLDPKLFVCTGP